MNYVLDKKIVFSEETENRSLYKWRLNEYDKNGTKIGRDLIPWEWNFYLMGSSLKVVRDVLIEQQHDKDLSGNTIYRAENKTVVMGVFHSGLCIDGVNLIDDVAFSMFGTDRKIKEFQIFISQSETEKEQCKVYGSPSYEHEIDFRDEIASDFVQFNLTLSENKFTKIVESIESKKIDSAVIRIGQVAGFYSDWSPSISTYFVKILTNSHEVEISENSNVVLPVLGEVGTFSISFSTVNVLSVKPPSSDFDIEKEFEELQDDYISEESKTDSVQTDINHNSKFTTDEINEGLKNDFIKMSIAANSDLTNKLITNLKIPLWFIFAVLVLILVK